MASESAATAAPAVRPDLWEDDNERLWLKGHETDDTSIRIAVAVMAKGDWSADDNEAFEWATDARISRVWYRDAKDPTNDELMVLCEPTDDGAEPFTRIDGDWS